MAVLDGLRTQLAVRLDALLPHLNERQRRLLLGVEARLLGHGGIRMVALLCLVSPIAAGAAVARHLAADGRPGPTQLAGDLGVAEPGRQSGGDALAFLMGQPTSRHPVLPFAASTDGTRQCVHPQYHCTTDIRFYLV
ncbi:hypothetical protein GCM10022225_83140 [Plantactinospora mayteni]